MHERSRAVSSREESNNVPRQSKHHSHGEDILRLLRPQDLLELGSSKLFPFRIHTKSVLDTPGERSRRKLNALDGLGPST